jgi:CRP/FNR family nitrogen fixation transcriptional regulator
MGPEADGLYQVVSGMLQCGVISEDGNRWISGFILPREVMLFEHGEIQSEIAQALCETTLIKMCFAVRVNPSCMDPHLYAMITSRFCEDQRRADRRIALVAKQNGAERLAYFLLELVDRLVALDLGHDRCRISHSASPSG